MAEGEHEELQALKKRLRLTHGAMADRLGVSEDRWKSWFYCRAQLPAEFLRRARALAATDPPPDVREPEGGASEPEVDVPYIGKIAASTTKLWDDPLEADLTRSIPVHMLQRGTFCAEVEFDSMVPLLHPEDLAVFVKKEAGQPGQVVLYIHSSGQATIKQLKYNGARPMLHALNPEIPDVAADGKVIGVLTGWVRKRGRRKRTDFDPDGLAPDFF